MAKSVDCEVIVVFPAPDADEELELPLDGVVEFFKVEEFVLDAELEVEPGAAPGVVVGLALAELLDDEKSLWALSSVTPLLLK